MGFECVATALIQMANGACPQTLCRHPFRHGNRATTERMRQDVVLRGLRGRPPPFTHEYEFHSNSRVTGREPPQIPQSVDSIFKFNALRCGDRCLEARENSADPRNPRRERDSSRNFTSTQAAGPDPAQSLVGEYRPSTATFRVPSCRVGLWSATSTRQ